MPPARTWIRIATSRSCSSPKRRSRETRVTQKFGQPEFFAKNGDSPNFLRKIRAVPIFLLLGTVVMAQRGPAPDPFVKADATVKLADHTYVIPDGDVPLVPNVGIIVGSRAALVID